MMGSWLAGHLKNWIAPASAGQWRSAQLPEGAFAAWGGSYYAIPRAARQPDLAWEFVQMLTLDATQQLAAFKDLDAFPALLEAQANAVMDEPMAYLGGQPARQLWRTAASRIAPTASDRYDPIAALVVQAEVMKVLDQGKPVRLALADAHQTLLRRVRRRGEQA
jgi:multiple sugar transport system substrate-binding protein